MAILDGKTALITGAGQGIGAAIAESFADAGARVFISDKDISRAEYIAQNIGKNAHALHLDVREENHWQKADDTIDTLDIMVNNAGITGFEEASAPEDIRPHNPEMASLSDWRAVMATNMDGVFLGCRFAIQKMKATGKGQIINIASRSGHMGVAQAAAYAASKAAIINHSRSVALYCASQGWEICCNSISPAAILTPIWEPMLGNGADRQANIANIVADTPLQRFGTAEEVAHLVLMLASNKAAYVTGSDFAIDGGLGAGQATRHIQQ